MKITVLWNEGILPAILGCMFITIIFLILQLTGYIHWNWIVVFLPILIPLCNAIIGFIIATLIIKTEVKVDNYKEHKEKTKINRLRGLKLKRVLK